jgi:phosphomannomutase
MPPKFGTSGLRGLAKELTDELCASYVRAFLKGLPDCQTLLVGRDLRNSSVRISGAVISGAHSLGINTVDCGELPTPALALAALARMAPCVMVTGSHIPADRNGLKFYTETGEITKDDETAIAAAFAAGEPRPGNAKGHGDTDPAALQSYVNRYIDFFGPLALQGMKIGNFQHSSVARDCLSTILEGLGATVVPFGRSDVFIPVDTEAVGADIRNDVSGFLKNNTLDAVVSTDGDGDRPMVIDEAGNFIPGDILGVLTAISVGAKTVVTPVSSNTMVELLGVFDRVIRTKIGSPFVIAAMAGADNQNTVGFEANGGFLLGFDAQKGTGRLPCLMTRDSLLPIIAPLVTAAHRRSTLSALVADLPQRHTAGDRLQGIATDASNTFVRQLSKDRAMRAEFFAGVGPEASLDLTDGLRVCFSNGDIVHLRPSGNAPEFRCYAESASSATATKLVETTLTNVRAFLERTA